MNKLITGVALGIAAGTVLALMFTPKGKKLRKQWSKRGRELADEMVDDYETVKDRAGSLAEKTRATASGIKNDSRHALS